MQKISKAVDRYRQLILQAERAIWEIPETGFREIKTTKYLAEKFKELGYEVAFADGITGFYTVLDTGLPGPEILVLGELDSVICPTHPNADKTTGAVHSCGHNAQCAALLGVAAAFKEEDILQGLCGRIKFCAVPAEELLEIEFRSELIKQGKIKYFGGKSEFLSRGYFDESDIALMVHTTSGANSFVETGSVGCLPKQIVYKGKAAHAGASPCNGRNALYAATCGINACNAIRERFKEEDIIRFHPIITAGGCMVNAIPDTAVLESYIRGKTFKAMLAENKQLNQALIGAALSIGTNIEIIDSPGYAPLINSLELIEIAKETHDKLFADREFLHHKHISPSSTDMGDLSCIMPVIHPYFPGAKGSAHGNDYYIADPEKACVESAKWQVSIIVELLKDEGAKAKRVISSYKPLFKSKKEFLDCQNSIFSSGDRIVYSSDGARITL